MLGGQRLNRVNQLIRQELSELIKREIEFEPGVLVTVTRVQTSSDLEHASVWISVLPSDSASDVLAHLTKSLGALQRLLNRKLVMESVPKLRLILDMSADRASEIERLLDSLNDQG